MVGSFCSKFWVLNENRVGPEKGGAKRPFICIIYTKNTLFRDVVVQEVAVKHVGIKGLQLSLGHLVTQHPLPDLGSTRHHQLNKEQMSK